jgi:excisionase family DNA binding protein
LRKSGQGFTLHKPARKGCARICASLSWLVVEETYTVQEASRVLKLTEARVRQMLANGALEGSKDPVSDRWRIPQHAVHARLEQRRPSETPRASADAREWIERAMELQRRLGSVEGRLQITERAESTLKEALAREQARADRLEERTEQLRSELEAERSKGFWARLFGQ